MFEIVLSALSAAIVLGLAFYILFRERSFATVSLGLLLILMALIEVSAQLLLHLPQMPAGHERLLFFAESLLPVGLLFFAFTYACEDIREALALWKRVLLAATIAFPIIICIIPMERFVYAPDLETEKMVFLGVAGYWYYMGILTCCVVALANLEHVFTSTPNTVRQKIKPELIGIGSIPVVLIFYYSQGLLYRTINMNLAPVMAGVFLMAAILIGYSRYFVGERPKVALSRYVIYRSLSLLFIGAYFIFLAIVGEGMRYFDVPFSRNLVILACFLMGMLLSVIYLSEPRRRRVKVFINKHFFAHKYDYRKEWLDFTGRLTVCKTPEAVHEVVISTFRQTFGVKGASLYLYDREKKAFILAAGLDMPVGLKEWKVSPGISAYFLETGRVLNPGDGECDLSVEDYGLIDQAGAKLIVALIANDTIEGLVALGEQLTPNRIIFEDFDLMKNLAMQAALSLANFSLSDELAGTRELAAMAKISSFIIHDLKNHAYTLSLLMGNAEANMKNPEFQRDMLDTIRSTTGAMKKIIEKLKRIPAKQSLCAEAVDISGLARATVEEMKKIDGRSEIIFEGSPACAMIDADEIKKVIVNLLLNAEDATAGKGRITVACGMSGAHAFIRIEDDGCGMTAEYIAGSLFRPFKSTKSSGLGIGLYHCRQIAEAHDGRIEVQSEPGKGTAFTVYLPVRNAACDA